MPAQNKPALNNRKKAVILAKKELQTGTQKMIAQEEGVSRKTVNYITPERVSDEVLSMVEDFKQDIIKKAKRNVNEGLDIMHGRMYQGDSKLSEITGAVKISHDILRLETDQSTSNVAHTGVSEGLLAFAFNLIKAGHDLATVMQAIDRRGEVPVEVRERVKGLLGD